MSNTNRKNGLLRKKRKKRGLTQEKVASYLGITSNHYALIERGEYTPSLKVAVALSDFFEIDVRDLL